MALIPGLSVGLLLAAAAGGCTRWQYTYPLPAPGEEHRTFGVGRVTTVEDRTMLVLRDVVVTADSVIGWHGETEAGRQRIAVHRSQVLVFDRRVTDHWRTGSAFLLGVATVWATLAVYFLVTVQV
ncbi:MAG TPA: hypothetical protein VE871_13165 [Longimicrobium sp.]|nr:hypothetical protein [Longimicrobium sp.]